MSAMRIAIIALALTRVMSADVETEFAQSRVVPDVIPKAPTHLATVNYPRGVKVQLGNRIAASQVKQQPTVSWDADENSLYTLSLYGVLASFDHWLVVNIPGQNIAAGDTIASHIGPIPPPLLGAYRYVYLVYKQPDKIDIKSNIISQLVRPGFSISKFADEHKLGDPVAGNFFWCQADLNL